MAYYIIHFLGNVSELCLILFFQNGRFEPRVRKNIFIPCCFAFVLLQFSNNSLFASESLLITIFSLILVFCLTLLYDAKWYERLFSTAAIYFYMVFAEIIVMFSVSVILKDGANTLLDTPPIFAIMTALSKFTTYFLILVTKKQTFDVSLEGMKKYMILLMLLPLASFLIILLFLWVCYEISDPFFVWVVLLTSVVLVFANVSIFSIINRQSDIIETEVKQYYYEMYIQSQEKYYQELYDHDREVSGVRHDMKNRLLSLIGVIESGEPEHAAYVLRESLDLLDEKKKDIVNSGNYIIDAVMQSKLRDAKQNGIMMDIDIKLGEKILIEPVQLGIVLGCLVDNAVEAADKVPRERKPFVKLEVTTKTGRVYVNCSNSVVRDFDTSNMSTTKGDRRNHGFGMSNITYLVNRYDGAVNFTCEDRVFTLDMSLENKFVESVRVN